MEVLLYLFIAFVVVPFCLCLLIAIIGRTIEAVMTIKEKGFKFYLNEKKTEITQELRWYFRDIEGEI